MALWQECKTKYNKYEWDYGLKEMNNSVTKAEVMWCWVMMSWCNVSKCVGHGATRMG